jgi:hypothetical protein
MNEELDTLIRGQIEISGKLVRGMNKPKYDFEKDDKDIIEMHKVYSTRWLVWMKIALKEGLEEFSMLFLASIVFRVIVCSKSQSLWCIPSEISYKISNIAHILGEYSFFTAYSRCGILVIYKTAADLYLASNGISDATKLMPLTTNLRYSKLIRMRNTFDRNKMKTVIWKGHFNIIIEPIMTDEGRLCKGNMIDLRLYDELVEESSLVKIRRLGKFS